MKLKIDDVEYKLYDDKTIALNNSSDKSKETLIVKSDKNYYIASTENRNSPTNSNFKITGNDTRYLHNYATAKKFYNPTLRPEMGAQADFEAHKDDYKDSTFKYNKTTNEIIYDYRTETYTEYAWYALWVGFAGNLPLFGGSGEYWSEDLNSVVNNANIWLYVAATNGVQIYQWYQNSRQKTRQVQTGWHYKVISVDASSGTFIL